jgi:hypothetical protein
MDLDEELKLNQFTAELWVSQLLALAAQCNVGGDGKYEWERPFGFARYMSDTVGIAVERPFIWKMIHKQACT